MLESLALALFEVAEGRLVPLSPEMPVLGFPAYWAICVVRYLNCSPMRLLLRWPEPEVV